MSSRRVSGLVNILRQAGFAWSSADEIEGALDRLGIEGCSADDVASALLRWRRKATAIRIAACRRSAQKMLDDRRDGDDQAENLEEKCHDEPPFEGPYLFDLPEYDTEDEKIHAMMLRARNLTVQAVELYREYQGRTTT